MKTNIWGAMPFGHDLRGDEKRSLNTAVAFSFLGHAVFFVLFVVTPSLHSERPMSNSVINVSMVTLGSQTASTTQESGVENKSSKESKAPKIEKPEVVKKPDVPPPVSKSTADVKSLPPKPKASLKKKTYHTSQVIKQAVKQLEEKVDERTDSDSEASTESLKSALDRLRKEVGKTESSRSAVSAEEGAGGKTGSAGGKIGRFNMEGKKAAELIDLYRLEIAYQIQKSWAFNEQLAGGDHSLVTAIVFKVMPDGEIRDIFFTDRSGNSYLDDSAYKAVMKSNPVDPHPPGLMQPYVVMAIRFTPMGIR